MSLLLLRGELSFHRLQRALVAGELPLDELLARALVVQVAPEEARVVARELAREAVEEREGGARRDAEQPQARPPRQRGGEDARGPAEPLRDRQLVGDVALARDRRGEIVLRLSLERAERPPLPLAVGLARELRGHAESRLPEDLPLMPELQ